MFAPTVVPSSSFEFVADTSGLSEGLTVAVMAGTDQGSVHLEVALSRLAQEERSRAIATSTKSRSTCSPAK